MTLFPNQDTLRSSFSSSTPFSKRTRKGNESQGFVSSRLRHCTFSDIFIARDALEGAKGKAQKLKNVTAHEFDKASHKAQDAAGPIELHSLKYFAACTIGGILACV